MANLNEVIRGLECCMLSYKDGCDECPYLGKGMCQELLGEHALALVKLQEPNPMPGAELTDAELMEKIRKAPITQKPAADAIPVEWIEGRLNAMLKGPASAESCFAVLLLLADWEMKQGGANDGKAN